MKIKLLIVVLVFCYGTIAQTITPDNSFGNNGILSTDINLTNDVSKSTVVQADGKIVAAGYSSDGFKDRFCLIRYNPDGTLDQSFGNSGIVITNFVSTSICSEIALQADGKIVAVGHTWGGSENEFALARYNTDGSLDNSFGNNGLVTTSFPGKNAVARALVIQPDGKLVAGGQVYVLADDYDDFALARYNTDGSLDQSFGNAGMVTTSFDLTTKDWINDLEIQADGKLIAGGFSNNQMALVRYLPNGTIDNLFGSSGLVGTLPPNALDARANSISLQSNGKIVVAGFSITGPYSDFTLLRYNIDGTLDNTFGNNGISITPLIQDRDFAKSVALQPDGKIIAGGDIFKDSVFQFAVARYNINGTLDTGFGNNGFISTKANQDLASMNSIVLQADDKIIASGFGGVYPDYDFITVRYAGAAIGLYDPVLYPDNMSIYPNPSGNYIKLEYELNGFSEISIQFYNTEGKLVKSHVDASGKKGKVRELIDITDLPGGVYSISVLASDKLVGSTRLIKR